MALVESEVAVMTWSGRDGKDFRLMRRALILSIVLHALRSAAGGCIACHSSRPRCHRVSKW